MRFLSLRYSTDFRRSRLVFLLRPPEVTKIVLPKVLQNFEKTPNCTCWPKELSQKGFPRTIQYRTRPRGPPFRFFLALCDFFSNFFSTKGSPFIFLEFCNRMDVEKSQRVLPFSFFRHCETFKKIHKRFQIHQYFDILKSFCYFFRSGRVCDPKGCAIQLFFRISSQKLLQREYLPQTR